MLRRIILAALMAASSSVGVAQVTGSLSGSVVDQNQASVPNAAVKVFLAGGKEPVLTGTTNSAGRFVFGAVKADVYDVGVDATGFGPVTYREVRVTAGNETALPTIELKVRTVSEIVEVVAEVQGVQTENAQVSTTISAVQLANLPLLSRQVTSLFTTQPGVISNGANSVVNGLKSSFTNITLDGINVQDNFIRTNGTDFSPFRVTIDQIEEITITTSNATAQYGGGASQFILRTKSGTNQYHGSAYWYNRNNALSSSDWFSNRAGAGKPKLDLNQPGVAFGGPVALSPHKVLHDKLFFYSNYEWFRDKSQSTQTRTVLTDSARNGIFTYDAGGVRRTVDLRSLRGYTPDPTVAALIAQLPKPNAPGGDGLNTSGYVFNASANQSRRQFVYKTDYYLGSKHTITGSYNFVTAPTLRPDATSSFYSLEPNVRATNGNHTASFQWRWSVTPTLSNELHGGSARSGANFDVKDPYTKFLVGGLIFNNPSNTFLAQGRRSNAYPIQDNATWIRGNHQVLFGYQYQRLVITPFVDGGIVPTYTLGISTANTTGLTVADLPGVGASALAIANNLYANLAGIISSGSQTFNATSLTSGFVPGATFLRQFNQHTHALYVQDNWKIRRNLTVNIGLRYELWTPIDEKNGLYLLPRVENNDARATLLNPNAVLDYAGGPSGRKFYRTDKNNFAPNVGFAWNPGNSSKTSVRGAYSISFANDNVVTSLRNNVGTAAGLSFSNTIVNQTATLANAPTIAAPAFKVPRTFADNYAITTTSAAGLPDPNLGTPFVHQWNVSLEHDLHGVLISARYIGNKGSSLLRAIDYNQVLYNANGFLADFRRAQSNGQLALAATGTYNGSYNANIAGSQPLTVFPLLVNGGNLGNAANVNFLRTGQIGSMADSYMTGRNNGPVNFYTNPNLQGANSVTNSGRSNYNALQLEATKRTRNGLQTQFSYTYGKALANTTGDGQTNFEPLLDNANPALEYARSPSDIRQSFKANAYYELPFGTGKKWSSNSLVNNVIGNWSVSGIFNRQSGNPYSVLSGYGTLNRGARSTFTNTASVAGATMDQLRPLTSGIFTTSSNIYFLSPMLLNTDGRGTAQTGASAFTGQVFYNPDAGTLGNLARRAFSGPWNQTFDISVIKTVRMGERGKLDLHFDFFNVFNHPTFYLPPSTAGDNGSSTNYTINNTTFGQITSTDAAARQIQIGARLSF